MCSSLLNSADCYIDYKTTTMMCNNAGSWRIVATYRCHPQSSPEASNRLYSDARNNLHQRFCHSQPRFITEFVYTNAFCVAKYNSNNFGSLVSAAITFKQLFSRMHSCFVKSTSRKTSSCDTHTNFAVSFNKKFSRMLRSYYAICDYICSFITREFRTYQSKLYMRIFSNKHCNTGEFVDTAWKKVKCKRREPEDIWMNVCGCSLTCMCTTRGARRKESKKLRAFSGGRSNV